MSLDREHTWRRANRVTKHDSRGFYDEYACATCGIKVKCYTLGILTMSEEQYKRGCIRKNWKVKVVRVNAVGKEFKGLTPGSVHDTISPPSGYDNKRGVWVMGATVPVLLLFGEFECV